MILNFASQNYQTPSADLHHRVACDGCNTVLGVEHFPPTNQFFCDVCRDLATDALKEPNDANQ